VAFDEVAREEAREQRVRCQDKNHREQVAADDLDVEHGHAYPDYQHRVDDGDYQPQEDVAGHQLPARQRRGGW